ncbi:MAG TPA: sugar phosphate isomerase/epimerase [Gemmatimonadaceae bacterium]|nr:sugar phosphate isomerase/epimerase [Gemmatimonadaceae bacterium]
MTSRREALKRLTAASALGLAASPILNDLMAQGDIAADGPRSLADGVLPAAAVPRCGVQLYTIRGEMQQGVEAALARVASIGYKEVEFAGYFGRTPQQVAEALKANGLTAPSVHLPVSEILKNPNATLDALETIGHKYAIMPYLDVRERDTIAKYHALADQLNEAGALTKKRGIQMAYHNHDFEFQLTDGKVPYDELLARCDRQLVQFEMDLFWTNKAGKDPLAYFAQHPGRFACVHVKDMKADGAMTEVGSGKIPFAAYFAKAKQAGIKHYFVEHDNPKDPWASITASYKALAAL